VSNHPVWRTPRFVTALAAPCFVIPCLVVPCLVGLSLPTHAAELGDPIDEAIAVQITPAGLDAVGDAFAAMVPETILIEASSGAYTCGSGAPLQFDVDEMDLLVNVNEVAITPSPGRIDLQVLASLSSTSAALDVEGDCAVLTDLSETCTVEIPVTALTFDLGMTVSKAPSGFAVDVDATELTISPITNPLSDCSLASAFGTVIGLDPEGISNLLMDTLEPEMEALGPSLAGSLEDALAGLQMDTTLAVGAAQLSLEMYPSLVHIDEGGIVLGLGSIIRPVGSVASCVDSSAGSSLSGAGWPEFTETAADTSLAHDVAILVGRDFVDHLLFSAWAGGLLCIDVADYIDGGLDAGFWGTVLGDSFTALFASELAATLTAESSAPPTVRFDEDGAPFRVAIDDLGLSLASVLDDRMSRVVELGVAAELGIDLAVQDGTEITTELLLDDTDLRFTEPYNELIDPGYSVPMGGLIGTLLGSLLEMDMPGGSLAGLGGVEIASLSWLTEPSGDWHGGYMLLDASAVEPVEITGCSMSSLGCGGGSTDLDLEEIIGCSGGCEGATCAASGRPASVRLARGRLLWGAFVVVGLLVRRRSR